MYIDGPCGVHRGLDAIKSELKAQAVMEFGPVALDVKSLIAEGGIVMLARVDRFNVDSDPLYMEIMEAFEIDHEGRIKRCRQSYDLKSIADQLQFRYQRPYVTN